MKKNKMLTTLMVLLMTVGCGTNSSTTASSSEKESSSTISTISSTSTNSSSVVNSSSTVSSSSSSSSSTESSSTTVIPESKIVLDEIQKGFATKSTYVKQYNNNTPTSTCVTSFISEGVAKWEHFTGSNWDNILEGTRPYKFEQYEKDENNDAQSVTYDSAGNVVYTPLLLKDPFANGNVEAFWEETNLDNAFARFTKENFIRTGDFTYELDLSETALSNEDYSYAVSALGIQMYMLMEGSEYVGYHFYETPLESYVITVDENHVPVSYDAKFVDITQPDGWGGTDNVHASINGEFTHLGSDSISKATSLETRYEELDELFATFQKHNYEFDVLRRQKGDGMYTSDSDQIIKGKSDGLGNFEVSYVNTDTYNKANMHFGYKQTSDNTYRKYSIGETANVWSGDEVEGNALDLLPSFLFSSALFIKNEEASNEEVTIYNFDKPALLNSEYGLDNSIINFGFDSIQGWLLVDLTIEVSEDKVVFTNNTSTERYLEATFTNIGKVEKIETEMTDPAEIIAGTYTGVQKIKNVSVTLSAVIKGSTMTISKDGVSIGSFSFTIDKDNQLILNKSVENKKFTVVDGSTIYNCSVAQTVKVDDLFNPSALVFEITVKKSGQNYSSSVSFTVTKQ